VLKTFAHEYADAYDALYADKGYAAECDLVEQMIQRHGVGTVGRILDLGCGTGGHAILLAARGYDVTAVDRSAEMLRHARAKGGQTGANVRWIEGDARSVEIGDRFDAVLLMFAVLSYQTSNDDVLATLRTVRRHLRPGGLVVFDVWYGPGVLTDRPADRTKTVTTSAGPVTRTASAQLDVRRQLCCVRYELSAPTGSPAGCVVEEHVMRYFFPMELELFLESADLELLHLSSIEQLDDDPDEGTWTVVAVARTL
jgi:SAM-dependent methyltransferase